MRIRWHSIAVVLLALASISLAAKERISILDFTRAGAAAQKLVTIEELQDLTQQVRDVATNLIDPAKFEVMTRENILVMLPPDKKDLSECEGQCEVETARNLGSRWHVVGDVKKVGSQLVLSVRLYDVVGGTQLGGVRVMGPGVDALVTGLEPKAKELFLKIPSLGTPSVVSAPPVTPQVAPTPAVSPQATPGPAVVALVKAVPTDNAGTATAKPGMVRIPAGCFQMGSPYGAGVGDEYPQHRVCLSAFSMDATEVTQSAYQKLVGRNPSKFAKCGGNCPVEKVSWQDANDYCRRMGERLPTEAEWEYAARAGTTTNWFWGDSESSAGDFAWYARNSGNQTHPVRQKRPNAWGLYDMLGNVWEWTADWQGEYPTEDKYDPTGPYSGKTRVVRGGSWFNSPADLRSAYRSVDAPEFRDDYLGFRCAAP